MDTLNALMIILAIIIGLRAISNGMIALGLYMQGKPWSVELDRAGDQIAIVFLLLVVLLKD